MEYQLDDCNVNYSQLESTNSTSSNRNNKGSSGSTMAAGEKNEFEKLFSSSSRINLSILEKILIALLVLSFIVILTLVFTLVLSLNLQEIERPKEKSCSTKKCIMESARILENMEQKESPCEKFYTFGCGNYKKFTPIPDHDKEIDIFSTLQGKVNEQIKELVEEELDYHSDEPWPFFLIKNYYKSCMNTSEIENVGFKSILEVIKKIGGWPMLDKDWDINDKFSWKNMILKSYQLGLSYDHFFVFDVFPDFKNSSKYIINLDQPGIQIDEDLETVNKYVNYLVDIFRLFDINDKTALEEAWKIVHFILGLQNIYVKEEERQNRTKLQNLFTLKELDEMYSTLNLKTILLKMAKESNIVLNDDELINVKVPKYFSKLEKLLLSTEKRILANFGVSRSISKLGMYLIEDMRILKLKLDEPVYSERWKTCIDILMESNMASAIGNLYAAKYSDDKLTEMGTRIYKEIIQSFLDSLKTNKWMDPITNRRAMEKIKNMNHLIGHKEDFSKIGKLIDLYSNVVLNPNDFFGNKLNLTIFGNNYTMSKLRQHTSEENWIREEEISTKANAFYLLEKNTMVIPVAILQSPFLSLERPNYLNYAIFGWVTAHEISHSLDNEGRQYDKDGNLENWWMKSMEDAYNLKAQCFIEQYGNLSLPNIGQENGINTLNENIADNVGILSAYKAYKSWTNKHGYEEKLIGLEKYSHEQHFWIGASQLFCYKMDKKTEEATLKSEEHSLKRFRVQIPLANFDPFSKAFNCSISTPMNPIKKCNIF